jgi:hypothetical protein
MLQPSVVDAIPSVFAKWEGDGLPYMYTDSKGIVTCGTGNALFTAAAAEALCWYTPSGFICAKAEVDAAFATVKSAWPKVQSTACARLTNIRLNHAGIVALVMRTVQTDWTYLLTQFPGCEDFPADAQLALLSSAWAWGPGFARVWGDLGTKFKSLLSPPPQYVFAAQVMLDASVHEEKINPGIIPRDEGEVVMLQNAGAVAAAGADYSTLCYPKEYA